MTPLGVVILLTNNFNLKPNFMKLKTTIFSILVCVLCLSLDAIAQPACTGVSQDGYYNYTITQEGADTYMTFIPAAGTTTGSPTLLFFYSASLTGATGANSPVPNTPFKLTGLPAAGNPVYFYFVYSSPEGQRDNSANRHSFIVGNCSGSGTPNVSPEVVMLPAVGERISPAQLLLKANAIDPDEDGTITKVEFYNGGVKIGEATVGNQGTYSLLWDNVQPGTYNITAKATDNKFGTTTSDPSTITVTGEFTQEWCGTSVNGQYQWKAETIGSNVKITFHPLGSATGGATRLIYTRIGSSGGWAGNPPMTADGVNSFINIAKPADGEVLSFYFTYNGASMGENNSSADPESYTVGTQCAVSTLPVSLINFNSKVQTNGSVSLNWSTASENNNSYFLIERSADGITFNKLTRVYSKDGNSTSRLDYQFTDENPLSSNNYYKLSQFDNDGKSKELGLRVEKGLLITQSSSIYPNPLKVSAFNVVLNEQINGPVSVSVSSISGKEIYRNVVQVASGNLKVELPFKPSNGIYLVKVGENQSFKLLVQ